MSRGPACEVGETYGRLTVVERSENQGRHTTWLCLCECGGEKVIAGRHLRGGETQSCGCAHREAGKRVSQTNIGRRKAVLSYSGIHMRVRLEKGPAATYKCPCGKQAEEWAYNHCAKVELYSPSGSPYSLEAADYDPLCRTCHKAFDLGQAAS